MNETLQEQRNSALESVCARVSVKSVRSKDNLSIIELERELYVAFALRTVNQTQTTTKEHARRIQNRRIREIEKLNPKLKPLRLTEEEFLFQADIRCTQSRTPYCPDTTGSERTGCSRWLNEGSNHW